MPRGKRLGLALVVIWFVAGGLAHFLATGFFLHIMPGWVPWPTAVIYVSGVIELLLAGLLLLPRWRPLAGIALLLLIAAVSTVNIHMWLHPERFPEFPAWLYTARLWLQLALMACVWWSTRPEAAAEVTA